MPNMDDHTKVTYEYEIFDPLNKSGHGVYKNYYDALQALQSSEFAECQIRQWALFAKRSHCLIVADRKPNKTIWSF